VSFGGFDCCLLFVVGGGRNKLESTLLTLILTPLKPNTQSVCGLGCTLLNPTQVLLNHLLTQHGFLKTCGQIVNLLLKLGVLFGSMEKLTLERDTCFSRRGQNSVARKMIKFVLKIFNLNGSSLQIRSKHQATSAGTQKCGTSFELSEFQPGTVKQHSNMQVNEPQIYIVNHDHSISIIWLGTHIIVRGSKRSNLIKRTLKLKIQLFILVKNFTKQLVLVAKSIFKFGDSQGKTPGDESSLTSESELEMCRDDLPMRQRPVKSPVLRLGLTSSLKLKDSSLEKLRSPRAAHTRDIIF
jgi:hypothetical protein